MGRGFILACGLVLAGCGSSQYLTEGYGRSYRAALERQAARPADEPTAEAVPGLDSQEASIISASYRASLVARGQSVEEEPIVFVAPGKTGRTPYFLPPPSVPQADR
jgi:hypothetical protein